MNGVSIRDRKTLLQRVDDEINIISSASDLVDENITASNYRRPKGCKWNVSHATRKDDRRIFSIT